MTDANEQSRSGIAAHNKACEVRGAHHADGEVGKVREVGAHRQQRACQPLPAEENDGGKKNRADGDELRHREAKLGAALANASLRRNQSSYRASRSIAWAWMRVSPAARIWPPCSQEPPCQLLMMPPAPCTTGISAATSQRLKVDSTMRSTKPSASATKR